MSPKKLSVKHKARIQEAQFLHQTGRITEAAVQFEKLLKAFPSHPQLLNGLGTIALQHGNLEEGVLLLDKSLRVAPNQPDTLSNRGIALAQLNRLEEAIASFDRAIALKPDFADAYCNRSNVLLDLKLFEEALINSNRAIALRPDFAEAYNNRGNAFQELKQFEPAFADFDQAIALKPDYAGAYYNRGNTYKDLQQFDEAAADFEKAIAINPYFSLAHINLGNVCKDSGRFDEAIDSYRHALALDPSDISAHSNLIYSMCFHPLSSEQSILAEVKHFAAMHCLPQNLKVNSHFKHDKTLDRRLRIGYVSPDFRNHCQSFFTLPLLSNHDHNQFEIYCYAQLARPDEISERLACFADVWRITNGKTDAELAEIIASDSIDILVDLTMHMANGRPMTFAHKPAPVQIAWLAYPGTTGLPAMDYRLTDPWLDPPELGDDRYTEISIRLPDSFWCYDPLISDPEPNPLPALTAGYFTFGCLNNFCKVSDQTLSSWGEIMRRIPASHLILLAPAGHHRQRVFKILNSCGVAVERIEFVQYCPRAEYLQHYHRIDLCLDTLPYNGHTTSIDSHWMGVPVVTQVGHTVVGRAGWSLLNNIGLPELAAFDEQTFVDIAVALAGDLPKLSQLRSSLRSRLQESPLMNGKRFAASIETVYRQMWKNWCADEQLKLY